MSKQADDERRYALDVLGELVGYLGKKVWLRRHLVEAMTDAQLAKADRAKFRERLVTAAAALEILESYLGEERKFGEDEMRVLGLIKAWPG